jgi:hypothetical protein
MYGHHRGSRTGESALGVLMLHSNPVAECYLALVDEADADTCCKRIRVVIQRMRGGGDQATHERHFMALANQLVAETKSFGVYVVEIYTCVMEGDHETAVQICDAMIQHEAMLHEIAAGRPLRYGATIN